MECLWSDLVHGEIRWNTSDGTSCKGKDEEKIALVGRGKWNKSQSKPESSQGGKKKYLSKIKCFHCHEFGHYATKCPHKNPSKKNLEGGVGESFASQFELYFTLIACMVRKMMGSVWYLDSSASFHMTGCRQFFSYLEEEDLKMHIEMRYDRRYNATKICIFIFQRDLVTPLRFKDVIFILGLNKNIISFAVLEHCGYDVIFRKGKALLSHIAMG